MKFLIIFITLTILLSGHINQPEGCGLTDKDFGIYEGSWKNGGLELNTVIGVNHPLDIVVPIITRTGNTINITYELQTNPKQKDAYLCGIMHKEHTFFIKDLERQKYEINLLPKQNSRDGDLTYSIFIE